MPPEEHIGDEEFEDPEGFEGFDEIDEVEREALHQDLLDVKTLKAVLGSRGIRGVVVYCPDCEADHFLGWDLLAGNLQEILEKGQPPVHEPAWEPDPDEYVSWDYARGFLDGYEGEPVERSSNANCGYCGGALPEGGYEWAYCPACGKDLAPINLIYALRKKGWPPEKIAEVMQEAGFEPPLFEPHEVSPKLDIKEIADGDI